MSGKESAGIGLSAADPRMLPTTKFRLDEALPQPQKEREGTRYKRDRIKAKLGHGPQAAPLPSLLLANVRLQENRSDDGTQTNPATGNESMAPSQYPGSSYCT